MANLILPISCQGFIFGTHMEALGMMGVEFSLPFPPYHPLLRIIWPSGRHFLNFHPLPRYINVPGLFGQPDIANILSWHYLWKPCESFGHDRRRIQPTLPSLPSAITSLWARFCTFTHFQDI